MNLKRVIKVSISTVCLGLMIAGCSTLGIEVSNETSLKDELKNQIIEEEMMIRGKSREYAEYCALLEVERNLSKRAARIQAVLYAQERKKSESFEYADYYALKKIKYGYEEEEARLVARIYDDEIRKNKSREYAEYYTDILFNNNFEEEDARIMADLYIKEREKYGSDYADLYVTNKIIKKLDENIARKMSELYIKEIKTHKEEPIVCYCYSFLRTQIGLDESETKRQMEIYKKEVRNDNVSYSIECYMFFKLIGMEEAYAKKMAKIYNKEIYINRNVRYTKYYAYAIVFLGLNKEEAIKTAKGFEKELADKSDIYIDYYICSLSKGNSKEIADIQAKAYEEGINAFKSNEESQRLAKERSMKVYKEKREKEIYENIKDMKEPLYAKYYAKVKANKDSNKYIK